jgi:hypothetical protein
LSIFNVNTMLGNTDRFLGDSNTYLPSQQR